MSYSIGDGMVALALAGGILGYLYIKQQERLRKIGVVHEERMAAMEKGIPLPEFPFQEEPQKEPDPRVLPILGIVLASLSIGTMIALAVGDSNRFWIVPLPFAFLGFGLLGFHFMQVQTRR